MQSKIWLWGSSRAWEAGRRSFSIWNSHVHWQLALVSIDTINRASIETTFGIMKNCLNSEKFRIRCTTPTSYHPVLCWSGRRQSTTTLRNQSTTTDEHRATTAAEQRSIAAYDISSVFTKYWCTPLDCNSKLFSDISLFKDSREDQSATCICTSTREIDPSWNIFHRRSTPYGRIWSYHGSTSSEWKNLNWEESEI